MNNWSPACTDEHAPTTIYDVAASAGVSHQTVSRVINNHPGVAVATRARVLHAAADLGFVANHHARNLRRHHRPDIGVVIVDDSPPTEVLARLCADARSRQGVVVIDVLNKASEDLPAAVERLLATRIGQLWIYRGKQLSRVAMPPDPEPGNRTPTPPPHITT